MDIQGLRALAVLAVIAFHAAPSLVPGGFIGVDVFFVISGFLITTHLVRSRERGELRLSAFYARRIRRLLPASALVIVVTVIAAWLTLPPLLMAGVAKDAAASALYVPNILFAVEGADYWAAGEPSLFKHFWSLGVEEQFYLFWPLLLLLGLRGGRRGLWWMLGCVAAASLVASIVVTTVSQPWAFFMLPTRAWEFAAGGVLALVPLASLPAGIARLLSWTGIAGLVAVVFAFDESIAYPGAWAIVPVVLAMAVIAGDDRRGGARAVIGLAPARWIGDVSYSLYLWHWPALVLPVLALGRELTPVETIAAVAATFALSTASYYLVERPVRFTPLLRRSRHGFAFGAVATIAVLGLTVASVTVPAPQRAAADAETAVALPADLTPALDAAEADLAQAVRDRCHIDTPSVEHGECVYSFGDNQRVVLFGDSHAVQWFPAFASAAEANRAELMSLTKSACPAVMVTVENAMLKREYSECDIWRASMIERINAYGPDVVVVSSNSEAYRSLVEGDFEERWGAGVEALTTAIEAPVVVLSNTPLWPEAVPNCLSRNSADIRACSAPLAEVHDVAVEEVERANAERFVDVNAVVCPDGVCDTVEGSVLKYRDINHLTATWAGSQAEWLWSRVHGE